MSGSENQNRPGGRVLTVLFWIGVGLAPLAALLLLIGQGEGPLRIAAVVTLLAVVLIGLSITLRRDTESVRVEMEETLLDEVDLLREDMRQDIATAARAQHRQFSERFQTLYESVEALRSQADVAMTGPVGMTGHHSSPGPGPSAHGQASVGAAQVGAAPVGHARVGMPPAGMPSPAMSAPGMAAPPIGGVVRHTETVQVTTRHTIVDPHADGDSGRGGTVYGGTAYGSEQPAQARPPGGSVAAPVQWSEPAEESWTEQRLRERLSGYRDAPPAGMTTGPRGDRPGDGRRPRPYERDQDEGGWSAARSGGDGSWAGRSGERSVGDRWAEVRSDERGRELRMGERRAAVHSDESGTAMRIEDRWASVRREEPRRADGRHDHGDHGDHDARHGPGTDDRRDEPRRWGGEERWSEDRWGPEVEDTGRWSDRWTQEPERTAAGSRAESRWSPPALPAASSEPSWTDRWDDSGQTGRRRDRDDSQDSGYGRIAAAERPEPAWSRADQRQDHTAQRQDYASPEPPRARQRRVDFESSDDRWR